MTRRELLGLLLLTSVMRPETQGWATLTCVYRIDVWESEPCATATRLRAAAVRLRTCVGDGTVTIVPR